MRLGALTVAIALAIGATTLAPVARADDPPPAKPTLTKPPKLVTFVEATYPPAEKAAGKTASVTLRITIAKDGKVTDAVVAESAGQAFDEAAVAAVRQFVFEPAEVNGAPSAIRILYRYDFKIEVAKRTTAIFDGTVRERKAHRGLAGISVTLDTGESAITGADGSFHFDDVKPGGRTVTLKGEKLTEVRLQETMVEDQRVVATYDVDLAEPEKEGEKDDLEIVVVAPPVARTAVATAVPADQARKVAGTGGDVLKVVENMPGVARASAGSGAIVVWGAAPEDTRVYLDGVRLPRLYHDGGVRSVYASDLVASVELQPGGWGAGYGRSLGGLLTVKKKALTDEGVHGSAQLDILDAAASTTASLGKDWHVAVAARRSHLSSVLDAVSDRDIGAYFPIPHYYDAQLRLVRDLAPGETVEVGGLLSSDETSRNVPSDDPALAKRQDQSQSFERAYVEWRIRREDGSETLFVPWVGHDRSSLVSAFGATPTELAIERVTVGTRATHAARLAKHVTLRGGVDVEVESSRLHRAGSIGAPPREGDAHVFGQAPSDQINADDWNTVIGSFAPFLEADFGLFDDRLHVVPGARFEPYFTSTSRKTPVVGDTPAIGLFSMSPALDPRVAVELAATKEIRLRAAYGLYHQPPLAEDLSAVFGSPTLGLARSTHLLVGVSYQLADGFSTEITVFRSSSDDLTVRSPLPSPLLAQALQGNGLGRAYGTQMLVRKSLAKRFFGWISYTIARSERTDASGAWRLFDYDQTHVLTALGTVDLGRGFEVSARVRYATGFPRTPVIGSYYDARADAYSPLFGAVNTTRIGAFFQADVRGAKRFRAGPTEVEVYLDVQNVTDRQNPEEIVYDPTYTQRRNITGLPILPVLGARVTW